MKFAIIVFPGSNCDQDAYHAVKDVLGQDAEYIWHKDTSLQGADAVILPGGFAHGDYLRTGAMARFSPVMRSVDAFARRGGLDRKSTRLNSSHIQKSRMPSSA